MGGLAHLDLGYNQIATLPDSIAGVRGLVLLLVHSDDCHLRLFHCGADLQHADPVPE